MINHQTCSACGNVQHAWQNRYCVSCWSTELVRTPAGAEVTLLSWATYHTDYRLDGFVPPYSVGLVQFDEGPRTQCLLVGDLAQASYGKRIGVRARSGATAEETAELTAIVDAGPASNEGGPR